jgi:hypothetical protein
MITTCSSESVCRSAQVSALRTEEYFGKGVAGLIAPKPCGFLNVLDNPPKEGDELSPEWRKKPGRKAANERDSAKHGQKKRPAVK